ncbi:hypothetical protein BGX38DRAFT_1189112 [Terfezia claveryi]|nr:hypothetical protein BGX38DRAFT_1189112 [Terfezia claveryi]
MWVNEYERVDDAVQRCGTSSSEASGSETPRPAFPKPAATLTTNRTSACFSSSTSSDSTPSTPRPILQTRGFQYQSPRPITPPTGTPSIRFHVPRPTGHLFLQKVFKPHIKQYGNLLLPPLSRILYEKWRKHSIPLYQKEPSLEEGWCLGSGDGRRERDRWLRLRSGRYEGQGVDRLTGGVMKRRCSDPGVRRCIGKMWTQAVDFVRAVDKEGGVKKVVRMKGNEALIGQRGMGMMYFPEWFSPGWESEDEEIFRFLHDDSDDGEEASDQDVNVVLKHIAKEKRRELTELLREFSEQMFLKEVDARLEWWWWQTRGATAGLAGREAERRREFLLLQEGRAGIDFPVEMEKEYYNNRFRGEVQEGMKWEAWRWETDVPEGVRDLGAYCFPKPPQGAGTRYLGRRASVDGVNAVGVDPRRWGIRYKHDTRGLGRVRLGDKMLERARRLVRGEERVKFGKEREAVKKKWEEAGGLVSPEELFSYNVPRVWKREKVTTGIRDALGLRSGGSGSVNEDDPVRTGVKVDGEGELTQYNSTVAPEIGGSSEGRKRVFIPGDGVASTRTAGEMTPDNGSGSVAKVTRKDNPARATSSTRSYASGSISRSSQSRSRGKGMTILMQHRRRRRRARSNIANAHAGIGVGTPMGGTKGWPSLIKSREGSTGSGYIAGDEDDHDLGYEVLSLSSSTFISLSLMKARNPSLAESRTGSRVPSWGTDESGESGRSVESVSSGYGGEWGWSRLGVRRRGSARTSHAKSAGENEGENENHSEWEGMEPLPIGDNDDGQFGEENAEIELIPEDVRGSWGRNGGYLGLGVLTAASEGKKSAKRRVLAKSDVSAPEMGRNQSRIDTPFERARSALIITKKDVSTSSCSLVSGHENVGNPPWFMSLRNLQVPEGSSGSGSANASIGGVGDAVFSDKEERKVERFRQVGRRVREVGAERRGFEIGVAEFEVEALEGRVDREKQGGARRRVVSEPTGIGAGMGLTLKEAERVFWDRSIRSEVEELWGPVGEEEVIKAQAVRVQVGGGELVELD